MENCLVFSYDGDLEFYQDIGYPLFDSDKNEIITGSQFDIDLGRVVVGKPTIAQKNSGKFIIAVVNWWNYNRTVNNYDYGFADLVICTSSEMPNDKWDLYHKKTCRLLNNENVIYLMNGMDCRDSYPSDRFFCPNLHFFKTIACSNKPVIYPNSSRPFLFDVLLGTKKLHRLQIFDFLKKSHLLDKSLVSLKDGPFHTECNLPEYTYESPILDRLEDPIIYNFKKNPSKDPYLNYFGRVSVKNFGNTKHKMLASLIISHKIYHNSWYSIISETNHHTWHFLTEKTAKCLFAKRIFLNYASVGTLKFLRDQGFKTFDGIIDESYDQEPSNRKRLNMIYEQILWLASEDPIKLYKLAKPILDHNFNMITKSDLNTNAMKNFIAQNIIKTKYGNSI